jgi:A/G-specific adenine glycosylase
MQLTNEEIQAFHEALWDHYAQSGRDDLPWRRPEKDDTYDPYKIMVSEIMLQQTQVTRVIPKYNEFLLRFPSIKSLADAELADVLRIWQGLGYNRRAKFSQIP